MPLITRLYSPDAFGLFGVFIAIAAILTPVGGLAYPLAIVLPKEETDAISLGWLSFYVALALSVIVAVAFLVGGDWILAIFGSEAISPFVMLIPIYMFFETCKQILQQWLFRKKQYSITAKTTVFLSIVRNGSKAGIGWLNPLGSVLILISTLGVALHTVLLWLSAKRISHVANSARPVSSLRLLARQYIAFPLYRAPQVLISAISKGLPILMLASFFGPEVAGFYAITKTALGAPTQLIGHSVGDVFYPRIASAAHDGKNLTPLILKATGSLAVVCGLLFSIVFFFGPWMFEVIFGAKWSVSGEYAKWLSFWFFSEIVIRPCVSAIPVLNLQKFYFIFEAVSVILRAISLFIGFSVFNSSMIAIALFSFSGFIVNFVLIWVSVFKSKNFYSSIAID